MDLSKTEKTYKNLTTGQLLKLVKERDTLFPEVIPVLRKELMSRGLEEEALKLDHHNVEVNPYENLSLREIQLIVSDRLETGESLGSIQADLSAYGVNVMNLFEKDGDRMEEAFKIIESEEKGIFPVERLQKELNYNEEEIQELKASLKSTGKWYSILGVFFVSCGVITFFLGLYIGIRWSAIAIMMVSGFGLLARGQNLSKVKSI